MTPSAALPGASAVLRVMRGAAGRRVLQVVLLVGGLLALGFLCGGQAHAADGASSGSVTVAVPTSSEAVRLAMQAAPAESAVTGTAPSPGQSAARIAEHRAEPWAERRKDRAVRTGGIAAPAPAHPAVPATGRVTAPAGTATFDKATADESTAQTVTSDKATARTVTSDMATADESTAQTVTSGTVTAVTGTVGRVVPPVGAHVVRPVDEQIVRPVEEHVLRPVTEQVVKPVGALVETVTGGLADGLSGGSSQFPPLPGMPSLPELPDSPGLPESPGLPGVPGLPGIPADTLPIGTAPQQPGGAAPERQDATEHGDGDGAEARSDARPGVAYGPRFAHGTEHAVNGSSRAHGADTAPTPAHQAPGDPTGALGQHSAVDNGGSRHGEPHAVTLDHRAPMSLASGVAAAVAADGTRDRHRDIPVFPG